MNKSMCSKLLAGIAMTAALVASGTASAVSCNTVLTIGAWQAAGSCTDADGDTLFSFGSSTLDSSTGFSVAEFGTTQEVYDVGFDFGTAGLTVSGNIVYTVTSLNNERFVAARFDTTVPQGPTVATKQLSDIGGPSFLLLTSANGQPDPSGGGFTNFAPRASFLVTDTFNPTSPGVFTHSDNSFVAVTIPEPESYAMMLAGLGLMGFVMRRRKGEGAA